jgi:ATPase subunit of ABC transporter with duplicated ATPase domains
VPKRSLTIGLLAQEANLDAAFMAAATIRQAVRSGAADVEAMEVELAAMEAAGAEAVAAPAYAALRERFEARDGYHLDLRVDESLSGLGFARDEWRKPPSALSGGEQTRASLAWLVVSDPDVILLDEPTNHLDVAAIEWLEQALVRRDRALLVASHDRAFLDAVANRIWELRDRRLAAFRGGYSAYLLQREAADARAGKEAETAKEAIARERSWSSATGATASTPRCTSTNGDSRHSRGDASRRPGGARSWRSPMAAWSAAARCARATSWSACGMRSSASRPPPSVRRASRSCASSGSKRSGATGSASWVPTALARPRSFGPWPAS